MTDFCINVGEYRYSSRAIWLATACAAVLSLDSSRAQSQDKSSAPSYQPSRYNEDYRYLKDLTRHTDVWDRLKYISLSSDPDTYLSLGGELRERQENNSSSGFGIHGKMPNSYLLHRLLLSADLHLGRWVRIFAQLGSELEADKRKPLSPTDLDRLDFQQAFFDVRLPLNTDNEHAPIVRVGRQEIGLGSGRIVSVRESPNVRRSFDGARLLGEVGGTQFSALAVRPVSLNGGVFDDHGNRQQSLWGVYTMTALPSISSGSGMDVYYLGYGNTRARYATSAGSEHRQTLGVRVFGAFQGWDWDWEAIGQLGSVSRKSVVAWSVATNTGYVVNTLAWKPRLGLKVNMASGNRRAGAGTLATFNPLFPNLSYFNEAALLAPSNFIDANPSVTLRPTSSVSMTIGWDFLWRSTTRDAVYVNSFTPLAGTAGHGNAAIGNQISLDATWQVDRHLVLSSSFVHFTAGSSITAVKGHDVDFGLVQAAYKF